MTRAAVLYLALTGAAWAANTDTQSDVQELVKAGRTAEALRALDSLIAKHPTDPQPRFQKGVLLVDQKRSAEAIAVFQRMGQDFPALPEPFNNLAVLYVEQGQLDKARAALESAIRSRPNYGTAFQNLGDVYTRMAGRAYSRALQIEDPEAPPKLALIRALYEAPAPAGAVVVAAASAPAAPARPPAPASAPSAPTSAPPAPSPAPAASAAAPAPGPAPAAAPATAASAAPAPAPAPAATLAASDETRAVSSAVRDWAAAWGRKDMSGYFASYVPGFKGNEPSASAWQQVRRERITGKRKIVVEITGLKVNVSKDVAKVSFKQSYVADLLRVSSQKTLELEHHNGKWLIRKESTG